MQLINIFHKNLGYCNGRVGWVRAIKWVYLLNLSTTTNITSFPSDLGSPSIKSIQGA
jgi:hypothetical protein